MRCPSSPKPLSLYSPSVPAPAPVYDLTTLYDLYETPPISPSALDTDHPIPLVHVADTPHPTLYSRASTTRPFVAFAPTRRVPSIRLMQCMLLSYAILFNLSNCM